MTKRCKLRREMTRKALKRFRAWRRDVNITIWKSAVLDFNSRVHEQLAKSDRNQ